MEIDSLELDIRGMVPRPYSTTQEGPWRKYIAKHVEEMRTAGALSEAHLLDESSACFFVSLVFHAPREIFYGPNPPDIDNLSKSVLDTLFCSPKDSKYSKGALYNVDDHHVWKLHLEKRLVESEEDAGVSITINTL